MLRDKMEDILTLLKEAQRKSEQNYLSQEKLKEIAQRTGLTHSQIYGIASFYSLFSLRPRGRHIIRVCQSGPCHLLGSRSLFKLLEEELGIKKEQTTSDGIFTLEGASCLGRCEEAPVMMIDDEVYGNLTPDKVRKILTGYKEGEKENKKISSPVIRKKGQPLFLLENCGRIDPENIAEYISRTGYKATHKALLEMKPEEVIEEVKSSRLQGRGGAGFPTGLKWELTARAKDGPKYLVCNADEGEPGTFKDRVILEGDPHRLLEGMIIAGYAVGAKIGYIYIRGEYSPSISRFRKVLKQAKEHGFLGKDILGSGFSFQIRIREGAGSYICGEETALIESLEGKRGNPRLRPPFPPSSGLWQKPTLVNNVETLANIPSIILKGGSWFRRFETKLYPLSGDINHPGLVEAPLGTTLGQIIEDWGEGVRGGSFKMAQVGGTAGPILNRDLLDLGLDYDSLRKERLALGSGTVLVMNEKRCIVDMLLCFLKFFQDECCGKCIPGRIGTNKLVKLMEGISRGQAQEKDLDLLLSTAKMMAQTSLCALGQSPILPISTSLKYFGREIREHLKGRCPAGVCRIR